MTYTASDLLDSFAKHFRLVTFSVATDGLHKSLAEIETSGSSDQRKWATEMKNTLKDSSQVMELKSLFKRRAEDAQDELDAFIVGTANAMENSIAPVLENVGKRVLARTASNNS
ncbi:hypothetical protein BGZ65_004589, partial [Modicella reniformis]